MAQRHILDSLPLADATSTHTVERADERADGARIAAAQLGPERVYDRGATVVSQGEQSPGLYLVRKGLLQEAAVSPEGRWFVHDVLGPGDVFGSMAARAPSLTTVRTIRQSRLVSISATTLSDVLHRRPEVGWWLLARVERRLARAQVVAHDLAWSDVPSRVRRRLHALACSHGTPVAGGMRIDVPLTQEDLGAMVGAARETVNRVVVGLIAAGAVRLERRRYVLRGALIDDDAGLDRCPSRSLP
jgi:CRP/FNR family cyclic AMP-dependent transcriptional regulator